MLSKQGHSGGAPEAAARFEGWPGSARKGFHVAIKLEAAMRLELAIRTATVSTQVCATLRCIGACAGLPLLPGLPCSRQTCRRGACVRRKAGFGHVCPAQFAEHRGPSVGHPLVMPQRPVRPAQATHAVGGHLSMATRLGVGMSRSPSTTDTLNAETTPKSWPRLSRCHTALAPHTLNMMELPGTWSSFACACLRAAVT